MCIAFAMVEGRPRRNLIYREIARLKRLGLTQARICGGLKQQLSWWLGKLRSIRSPTTFFYAQQPDTPLLCSDASGEDGWGVCTMGFHIVGNGRQSGDNQLERRQDICFIWKFFRQL